MRVEPLKITINGNEFTLPVFAQFGDYIEYGRRDSSLKVQISGTTPLITLTRPFSFSIPVELYGNGKTLPDAISDLEFKINKLYEELGKYTKHE